MINSCRSSASHFLFVASIGCGIATPGKTSAQEEPFGLRMGMTVRQLQRATGAVADSGLPGMYSSFRVPRSNPFINDYTFFVAPSTGLCAVSASGIPVRTDSYGTELRARFDFIQEALDQKYGPHKTVDELRKGSLWGDSHDWMMALFLKDRVLRSGWLVAETNGNPSAPVRFVALKAQAKNSLSGFVHVSYQFSNFDKCLKELKKLGNSSL